MTISPGWRLSALGIDDWAWRKSRRYGALICDRERRLVIDQLSDREPATVSALARRAAEHRDHRP
ncbi:hypothetical protein [Acuticoccus sediminis]|uniref:hypothetical protein n=1 Tax=Acuticoccus sediminis TaxID=2184697 RepID=UPI0011B935A5